MYQKCLPELKRGPTSQYSAAMQGLAQCLQMQQKYSEALQYVKQLLTLPPEPNKNSGQLHAWIGVLLDLSNQPDAAVASYRKARAASGADSYEIWEPLRQACQAESDRKRFDVADSLFKRNLELLEPTADNTIAICNIWCQIARMHKYANHKAKAQQAYQKALAVLQSSGNKPSSKEQVENIRKEMGQ